MSKGKKTFNIFVMGIMMVSLLGGCSLYDRFFKDDYDKNPSELMSEGTKNMESGRYEDALEDFQNVRDRYPYSKFAVSAELKMADAMFISEDYDGAFEAYSEFERLHPKNKDIPYVMYRKGMCDFLQMRTIDRDQSHTLKAKESFEKLVRKYPRNEYAARAQKHIRKCLIYLAEHELQVGHYYFKRGFYRAAIARYQYLIEHYPDMGQYHEAIEYISKCQEKITGEKREG